MKVFVVGSGAREHAIAWKLSMSPHVSQLFVAPGNAGTSSLVNCENVQIQVDDLVQLRDFAMQHRIDLTVVGPEQPLIIGIVDFFQEVGLRIFGPSESAARIEGSKAFSKSFMNQYGIPTANAKTFKAFDEAMQYLHTLEELPVIKASGLAAGKGVIVPGSVQEAEDALRKMLHEDAFGEAGKTVLIEERLEGQELSLLAFSDGYTLSIMPPVHDYKRLFDGDCGPNTGGMGAVASIDLITPQLLTEIEQTILIPAIRGLAASGMPYIGVLYAGLILTRYGPKVLEFNCRFGDPETQVILPLLQSDLLELLQACIDGYLDQIVARWRDGVCLAVVMASCGYPRKYIKGAEIIGLEMIKSDNSIVFHGSTKRVGERFFTKGGRILAVTAWGEHLADLINTAYENVEMIYFDRAIFRTDIGQWAAYATA